MVNSKPKHRSSVVSVHVVCSSANKSNPSTSNSIILAGSKEAEAVKAKPKQDRSLRGKQGRRRQVQSISENKSKEKGGRRKNRNSEGPLAKAPIGLHRSISQPNQRSHTTRSELLWQDLISAPAQALYHAQFCLPSWVNGYSYRPPPQPGTLKSTPCQSQTSVTRSWSQAVSYNQQRPQPDRLPAPSGEQPCSPAYQSPVYYAPFPTSPTLCWPLPMSPNNHTGLCYGFQPNGAWVSPVDALEQRTASQAPSYAQSVTTTTAFSEAPTSLEEMSARESEGMGQDELVISALLNEIVCDVVLAEDAPAANESGNTPTYASVIKKAGAEEPAKRTNNCCSSDSSGVTGLMQSRGCSTSSGTQYSSVSSTPELLQANVDLSRDSVVSTPESFCSSSGTGGLAPEPWSQTDPPVATAPSPPTFYPSMPPQQPALYYMQHSHHNMMLGLQAGAHTYRPVPLVLAQGHQTGMQQSRRPKGQNNKPRIVMVGNDDSKSPPRRQQQPPRSTPRVTKQPHHPAPLPPPPPSHHAPPVFLSALHSVHPTFFSTLSLELVSFYEQHRQPATMLQRKQELRSRLSGIIKQALKCQECEMYIVGSSLNGFGSRLSDLDACLVYKTPASASSISHSYLMQEKQYEHLNTILSNFQSLEVVRHQELIQAKVPILRVQFTDPYSDISLDLNSNNPVGIRNTHLLYYYSIIDERCTLLALAVKQWAADQGINDASRATLSSYSLELMVIHYLQAGCNPPVLPCLQRLYPKKFDGKQSIERLCTTDELEPPLESLFERRNTLSAGQLLLGFFEYYSFTFDFEQNVISVRTGNTITRHEAILRLSAIDNSGQWQVCLGIEEPYTRTNTAAPVYDERVFALIREKFLQAYNSLLLQPLLSSVLPRSYIAAQQKQQHLAAQQHTATTAKRSAASSTREEE